MSARDDYLRWRRGLPVGCVFARLMSKQPANFGQLVEEVHSAVPESAAAAIAAYVTELVSNQSVVAVTLVLPGITTLR
jgi:hypothetical protein